VNHAHFCLVPDLRSKVYEVSSSAHTVTVGKVDLVGASVPATGALVGAVGEGGDVTVAFEGAGVIGALTGGDVTVAFVGAGVTGALTGGDVTVAFVGAGVTGVFVGAGVETSQLSVACPVAYTKIRAVPPEELVSREQTLTMRVPELDQL